MTANYPFRFFRMGGVDQVVLETSDDIRHLKELDIKLWMAVAMPTKGIALDKRLIRFLDENEDGRILVPDILRAIDWLDARLASLGGLFTSTDEIALEDISDEALRTNAAKMLNGESTSINLERLTAIRERFKSGSENGDGIITAASARNDEERALIESIIKAQGSVEDRSGEAGIDKEKIAAYFDDASALLTWRKRGESEELRPFGDATASLAALLRELNPKLDDYFTRSRMAAFDPRAVNASHGADTDFAALLAAPLSFDAPELKKLTLARIAPNAPLDFEENINPAYASALARFRDEIVRPTLGATARKLDEAGLAKIRARFSAFESYLGEKPETKLDGLSDAELEALINGKRAALDELVEGDLSRKDEYDRLDELESLMVLHRDFIHVLRNFVNFSEFYMRKRPIFQAGTLYLDGRACELSILVDDPATHMVLANLAGSYLAYCDLRRKGEEPRKIVAAFTAGSSDNLRAARNGVFIDRDGNYWDATITVVVENPISLRQAFFSPYKRFARMIEEQVSKRASSAEAESQAKLESAAARTANADQADAAAAAAPKKRGVDVGTVAAIGVAVGGIGAMVTGLVSTFLGLGLFLPFGILAIILAISLPSVILAYAKLRRRNLGPLLDASGWAVNGFAAINMPFGRVLTKTAALPKGATRKVVDPYAQTRRPFWFSVVAFILIAFGLSWCTKRLDPYLPEAIRAESVFEALNPPEEEAEEPGEPAAEPSE